jgi:hypothetical protein
MAQAAGRHLSDRQAQPLRHFKCADALSIAGWKGQVVSFHVDFTVFSAGTVSSNSFDAHAG